MKEITVSGSRKLGFTLIELLIVIAIIGILAAIAYPSYRDHVIKSRRADAQGALLSAANAMEREFTESNSYVPAVAGTTFPSQAPFDGGTKYYDLSIAAKTATTYTLRATPIAGGSQDGDGWLELDQTGARRWDRNNDNSIGSDEKCWETSCS